MTLFSVGQVWAVDVLVYTLNPASGSNNSYTGNCDVAIEDADNDLTLTWNIEGNSQQIPWRLGGKASSTSTTATLDVTRKVYSKSAMSDNINKVIVTQGTSSVNNISEVTLIVSTAANGGGTVISSVTEDFATNSEITFERPTGHDWTNRYYTFVYEMTLKGKSNTFIQFSKAEFYKEQGGSSKPTVPSANLAWGANSAKVFINGETYDEHVAHNALPSLTYDLSATLTYESTNTDVATISNTGEVTIKGVGSTTIKATYPEDGDYAETTVSYTLTVDDILTVAQAVSVIDQGSNLTNRYVTGTISQIDSYNSNYKSITYWISADGTTTNQFEVYGGLAGVVKSDFGSTDDLYVGDDVIVKGTLKKYNSVYEFDKNNVVVYYKPIARLSWGVTSFDASLEGENTFPTLTNLNNVDVTYESNNSDVVESISNAGVPTLKAAGSTIITASFAGNDEYKANSASYTLNVASSLVTLTYNVDGGEAIESVNVNALPNPLPTTTKAGKNFGGWFTDSEKTVEAVPGAAISENTTIYAKWLDPYTVAEAKTVIDNNQSGIANQYVAGIISQVDSYNSKYSSITYWISADGTTTDQLQVYSGKGLNGANFSEKADLQVGDQVVVCGTLKLHNNSVYEFDYDNTIYSFSRPAPKYTVRFWNSEGWDEVYAYVWKYDEVNDVTTEPVAWPGLATSVVDGWNEFEVEEDYNIIFNNNKSGDDAKQTIDIKNITADVCYVLTGETENTSLVVAADNDCNDRFYIAGDEALTGESWNTTADRLENGSITFTNIAANTYKFKITNGTWKWNIGGAKVDATACDGVTIEDTDYDGNVVFSIDGAKDITITYNKATDKIVVTAVDYVAPVYKAIVVSYGGKYYAMTTTLDGDGFTPLEVAVDADGNVIVNSDGEKNSILWKYTAGAETATFQDANNLYLAKGSGNTGLDLAATAAVWNWNGDDKYYYVTSGRTFLYQGDGNIFKNYSLNNSTGYSAVPALYAADKVKVSKTVKVRFFAPVAWENVKAFTWGGTDNGDHQMTAVEEGSRWFEGTIEKGVDFLFYNGAWEGLNQTDDQTAINEDKCFAWSGVATSGKYAVAEITTCDMIFSIAGDEALTGVAGWGHTALVNNTITYNEVAVGTYKFKISNGTWDWSLGGAYVDQTACSGVTIEDTDGDGNVVFSIAIKSNITITYNPATEKISIVAVASTPEILVDKAEIAFGTVDYEDAVDAEIINVTLISVANATISLSGDVDAFQLDKNALTASGIVSVTPVTTTSGTFNATLTISDAATAAEAKEVTLSLTVNEAPAVDNIAGTWNLVTSADQLAANKKVIIAKYVDADETVTLGMTQNTNNRAQVEGASVTGNVLVPAQGTAVFTLVAGTEENTWAFKSSANEYLYAASSAKNWLRSQTENDANGSWVISIENGAASVVAQGTNTRNTMRYNNSDHLFSCYASGQQDIAIYMLEEEEPEPQYETIRSGLTPGRYYTVCYDKTMKEIKGASLWSFNGKDANMAYIVEENLASYPAGTPYLIYAESDKLEAITEEVASPTATNNNGLYGTLTTLEHDDLVATGATHLLINGDAGSELRPIGNGGRLIAKRAYVILDDIQNTTPTPSNAPGKRVRAIPMHQDAATGIDELNASEKPVKMVIDGQLYILRGEKMYDATGRLVK